MLMIEDFLVPVLKACATEKLIPLWSLYQHYKETPWNSCARDNVGRFTDPVITHNLHKNER